MPKKQTNENDEAKPSTPPIDLGLMRELREMCNLTLKTVADDLGCDKMSLSRYENETRNPRQALHEELTYYYQDRVHALTGVDEAVSKLRKFLKKHGSADPDRKRLFEETASCLVHRADLLAGAFVGAGETRMTPEQWAGLFDVNVEVFKGILPVDKVQGEPRIIGYDVGVALDASLRGMKYDERSTQLGGVRGEHYATFSGLRLGFELKLVLAEIQIRVADMPETDKEYMTAIFPEEDE
jgi:transcriptional regulator with XRE-family HTH domain